MEEVGLSDINPVKLRPLWSNMRMGDDGVLKRLDRFLVAEDLLDLVDMLRKWVGYGGDSDHSLIVLDIKGKKKKIPSPFKFNVEWMKYPTYMFMVWDMWVPIPQQGDLRTTVHFMNNLNRIK